MEKRLRQRLSTLRNSLSGHLFFERYPDAGARQVEWEWRKSAALALDSRDSGAWRCLTTTSRPNSAGSAARMASAPSNMAVASSRRRALLAPRPGGNRGASTVAGSRSEERPGGKEGVSTCRYRGGPYH